MNLNNTYQTSPVFVLASVELTPNKANFCDGFVHDIVMLVLESANPMIFSAP